MNDIVFVPKYKRSYIVLRVVQVLVCLIPVALSLFTIATSHNMHISNMASIGAAYIVISAGTFVIGLLSVFFMQTRRLKISGDTMTIYTRLGVRISRPYKPYVYYEQEDFIINGYVFDGNPYKNLNELDCVFNDLALSGYVNYSHERGIFKQRIHSIKTILISILFPLVFLAVLVIAIVYKFVASPVFLSLFLLFEVQFMIAAATLKLAKANRRIRRQILNMFQAQLPRG